MSTLNFLAPERQEGESFEVYQLRRAQLNRHNAGVLHGSALQAMPKRPVEKKALKTATKILGPRQARKQMKEARRANKP